MTLVCFSFLLWPQPSTGGGGEDDYLPSPKAKEESPGARKKRRAREDAWMGGWPRGKLTAPGISAGFAELQPPLAGPKFTQPQVKLPLQDTQGPTLNRQLQNLTHHLNPVRLSSWKMVKFMWFFLIFSYQPVWPPLTQDPSGKSGGPILPPSPLHTCCCCLNSRPSLPDSLGPRLMLSNAPATPHMATKDRECGTYELRSAGNIKYTRSQRLQKPVAAKGNYLYLTNISILYSICWKDMQIFHAEKVFWKHYSKSNILKSISLFVVCFCNVTRRLYTTPVAHILPPEQHCPEASLSFSAGPSGQFHLLCPPSPESSKLLSASVPAGFHPSGASQPRRCLLHGRSLNVTLLTSPKHLFSPPLP